MTINILKSSRRFAVALALSGLGALGLIASSAQAQSPIVDFTTSGSTGNWTLDFAVTNNLNPTLDIYFFGVQLGANDIVDSPLGYDPNAWSAWDNAFYGGSTTVYNNNWLDNSFSHLQSGQTLSGFKVHTTDAVAPTDVKWFAYAYGGNYTGNSPYFNREGNPGFEGITSSAVPEPGSIALLFGALTTGAGFVTRRRRR